MGRPSNREARRAEILAAFARVLADHGYAGATIQRVASEAGLSAGLLHHHFDSKKEMLSALLEELTGRFRRRIESYEEEERDPLRAYADGALALDERADLVAARCWVGLFAEALREPALFRQLRRLIDTELVAIMRRGGGELDDHDAGAVLAFVLGSLVLGAFAPEKTAGFAAPSMQKLLRALREPTG